MPRRATAIFLCGAALSAAPATAQLPAPRPAPIGPSASALEADGNAAFAVGRWAEAERAYRAAVARIDPDGTSRALAVLRLYNQWGLALGSQRKVTEATAAYRAAADRCSGSSECGVYRTNLALALANDGHFDEAIAIYRAALSEAHTATPPNPARIADVHIYLAAALGNAGHFDDAIREGEAALKEFPPGEAEGTATVAALQKMAAIYRQTGRIAEAETIARRGAEVAAAKLGRADQETLRIKEELGNVYSALGRRDEAERYRREIVAALEEARPADPDLAYFLTELGFTLMDSGKPDQAETIYRKLLAHDLALHGESDIGVAITRHNLADAIAAQGRLEEAEAEQRRALAAQIAIDPQSLETAKAYEDLRAYLVPRGDLATAERYALSALAIKRQRLPPGDPETINTLAFLARSVSRTKPGAAGLAYAREARALAEGHLPTEDRADATAAINRALGSAQLRGAAQNYVYSTVMEAAAFTDEAGDRNDRALAREAFEAAQYLTVSRAGEAMAMTAARTAAGSGPAAGLAQRQQSLTAAVRDADAALTTALARGDAARVADARTKLRASGTALAAVDRQLRESFPGYADLIAPRPITIAEVQAALKPNEAMVAVVHADFDIHTFTITRKGVIWRRQEKKAEAAQKLVRRVLCSVDPTGCNNEELAGDVAQSPMEVEGHQRFDRESAAQFYQDFIAPAAPDWAGIDTVYTVATGAIADLPFSLLITAPVTGGDDADPALLRDTPWLSDKFALITLPSIAAFRAVRIAQATPGTTATPFLGYGDPVLAAAANSARGATARGGFFRSGGSGGLSVADPSSIKALPSLPGTRVELAAIARLFNAPADALELGSQATETRLRSDPRLTNTRVIAFATHGLLPGELSGLDEPGLVLTPPANPSAVDDGVLSASEAAQLSLRADWVILSACNTASAQGAGQSDSLSDLARAFLYAGAGALLASRWRIGDDVTAALTVETLRERLIPGTRRAVALQRAMRAVRTGKRADGSALPGWTPDWAHPAAWGPFALIANGDD